MTRTKEMTKPSEIPFHVCVMVTLSIAGCAAITFSVRYTIQGLPLRTSNGVSMDQCLRQCKLRAACKSSVYKRRPHQCGLYGQIADNSRPATLLDRNPGKYYAEPTWSIRMAGLGECLNVSCEYGLTCRPDGACVNRECGPPATRNYSAIDGNMFSIGAKLKHKCVSPFLDGPLQVFEISWCHDNGKWSNVSLACDCGTPLHIQNATSETHDVTPLGTNVTYNCHFGFTQIGTTNNLTCLMDGNWSTPMFDCVPINCGMYEAVYNSYTITTGGTTFGHTVEYRCIKGTTSNNGSNVAVCSGFGSWTPTVTLSCSWINCGPPKFINNTNLSGNLTTYGSIVRYICTHGYENTASRFVDVNSSCKANGDWSDVLFVCQPIPTSLDEFSLYQTDAFLLQQEIVVTTYGEAILVDLTLKECADTCRNETRFCIAISYFASNKTCVLVDRLLPSFASTGWNIWSKNIGLYYSYGHNGRYSLTFPQAKQFCVTQGTDIASYDDVNHAYNLGFNVNQCGWISDGSAVIVLHYLDLEHYSNVGINVCTWGDNKWGVFCLDFKEATF